MKWSALFNKMLEKRAEELKESRSNRKPSGRWTSEEVEFLQENAHLKAREIAEKLGRSIHAVRTKRRRLGLRSNYFWTEEEEQRLRELVAMGLTDKQIGEILGKSPGAVRLKRQRIGLYKGERKKR